jgi:hypothetical protein
MKVNHPPHAWRDRCFQGIEYRFLERINSPRISAERIRLRYNLDATQISRGARAITRRHLERLFAQCSTTTTKVLA